ncbi:Uncharacterised protein [Nocardia farcinica]|uniref:Uncharacterized protein n=1 Tax=Nocardia farcinica TaxID=37329 RepID=A0A449H1S4_NOCFR|nr:Uncharacterised protein [Nocardia farcinica]
MHGPLGRVVELGGWSGGRGSAGLNVGSGVNGLDAESSNLAHPASRADPSATHIATRPTATNLMPQTLRKHRRARRSRVGTGVDTPSPVLAARSRFPA